MLVSLAGRGRTICFPVVALIGDVLTLLLEGAQWVLIFTGEADIRNAVGHVIILRVYGSVKDFGRQFRLAFFILLAWPSFPAMGTLVY